MCACRAIGATAAAATSSAVLLLTAMTFPAPANAEPEHVRIKLSAPPSCPDAAAFVRAVRQRTTRFRLSSGLEQATTFVATIVQDGTLFSGRLETRAVGKEPSQRSVTGRTCDEVAAVLAFMTALAIDPRASSQGTHAQRPVQSSSPPPTTSPAAASERGETGAAANASPQPQSASPPASPPSPPAAPKLVEDREFDQSEEHPIPARETPSVAVAHEAAAASEVAPWKWSAGAHGAASLGMSPTTGFGGVLFVEAAAPGTTVLGPVLRAGVFLSQSEGALADGAQAKFQWAAALVEGCPLRLAALDARIALHACLAFHLGALRAQGQSLERGQQTTDLWSDLGPVARLRVAISERLFLETQGMLVFPLRRLSYDVYYAGPSGSPTTVHTMPWLAALVGIGMAYQFR